MTKRAIVLTWFRNRRQCHPSCCSHKPSYTQLDTRAAAGNSQ